MTFARMEMAGLCRWTFCLLARRSDRPSSHRWTVPSCLPSPARLRCLQADLPSVSICSLRSSGAFWARRVGLLPPSAPDWSVCSFVFCRRDLVVNDSVQLPARDARVIQAPPGRDGRSGIRLRRRCLSPSISSYASEMKHAFLSGLEARPHAASDDKPTERNQNREKQVLQFQSRWLLPLLAGFQSSRR